MKYRIVDREPNQAAKLANKAHITVDQLEELLVAAQNTWEVIAYDILQVNGGKDMPRSTVIEIVLDADHIASNNPNLSKQIKTLLRPTSSEHSNWLNMAMRLAFPWSRYGI